MKTLVSAWIIGVGLALAAGCGGGGPIVSDHGRGEGDIPIGRVSTVESEPVEVTVEQGGVRWTTWTTTEGTFSIPRPDPGPARIFINPGEGFEPRIYDIVFGKQQRYVMNAGRTPRQTDAVVTGISIQLLGPSPLVGETRVVKINVSGSKVGSLRPTIWIDGGVGTLDVGNRFTALDSGSCVIRAELMGFTAELPVVVP